MRFHSCIRIVAVATGLLWLGAAAPTLAAPSQHPAPSVIHDYLLSLDADELRIAAYLRVSPELIPEVYRQIDADGDGTTSEDEHRIWRRDHITPLSVTMNGEPVALDVATIPVLTRESLVMSIARPILVEYRAAFATPLDGKHRVKLSYGDNYLAYDEYYISVVGDRLGDTKPRNISQHRYPATYQVIYQIPEGGRTQSGSQGQLAPAPYTEQTGPQAANLTAESAQAPAPQASDPDTLRGESQALPVLDQLQNWRGSLWGALLMLALAFGIGALHALTPGHGKAVVAAYLIGTRGRTRDAVFLGGIVTLTHTFGVVALGLALLLLSNFSMPQALQPALQLISGLLVVGLGLYLLVLRARHLRSSTTAVERPAERPLHEHRHSHGGYVHSHAPSATPQTFRALIGLGISGGLVPCPDALAILLLAAGVGQFGLGLGLVFAFSIGLAAVLMGIGVVLVNVKSALERNRGLRAATNPVWTQWMPLTSAAIVVVVGLLMTYSSWQLPWS